MQKTNKMTDFLKLLEGKNVLKITPCPLTKTRKFHKIMMLKKLDSLTIVTALLETIKTTKLFCVV